MKVFPGTLGTPVGREKLLKVRERIRFLDKVAAQRDAQGVIKPLGIRAVLVRVVFKLTVAALSLSRQFRRPPDKRRSRQDPPGRRRSELKRDVGRNGIGCILFATED